MKDIGMIFSTPMVQAILDGRKTQTRRTRGLEEINKEPEAWYLSEFNQGGLPDFGYFHFWNKNDKNLTAVSIECPYQVGDRIYCRETWATARNWDDLKPSELPQDISIVRKSMSQSGGKWRPSIHMPKWAARIWLPITNVRCARLQEISVEDIKAEGVSISYEGSKRWSISMPYSDMANLWDSLNAKYGWDFNPWVFIPEWRSV